MKQAKNTILLVGGKGKTGRRVAERLLARRLPVRLASRSSKPGFDWNDEASWEPALHGIDAAYVTYYPDLAFPGASDRMRRFAQQAVVSGVGQLVLLSGRGESEVLPAERAIAESGARYTILRCAFFAQNFSEGVLAPSGDEIAFPAGHVTEPFVDVEDIADVAVAALTSDEHDGRSYDLTGPELLSFADVAQALSLATKRPIRYNAISFEAYGEALAAHLPPDQVGFLITLFRHLLDGHNSHLSDDVARVLGRRPRDFASYARAV
jgi:uncharacterized protein YbjT (DUF2867 family)